MPEAPTPAPAIRVFNRYSGQVETEPVYGEAWLRWTYETRAGRAALGLALRRAWFSRLYGAAMRMPWTRRNVASFIASYGLDASEFAAPESYRSFNDFFVRKLRPGARPIDPDPASAVFPADGRHYGYARAADAEPLWIKGERHGLGRLLGDDALAERYASGPLLASRLCPLDYHRFHFPVAGTPGAARLLPGPLNSVNPIALRRVAGILISNRRTVTAIGTEAFGTVQMVEVGATCVGSIVQTFAPGRTAAKGGEKGFFQFGGSAIVTLFEPGSVRLAEDLLEQTRQGRELYARMGDVLGRRAGDP